MLKRKEKKTKAKKEVKPSYFKALKSELAKVKWPDSKEVIKYSVATITLVVIFGVFFEGLNLLEALVKGMFN